MQQGRKGQLNGQESYPQKLQPKGYSYTINQLNSGGNNDYVTREINLQSNSLGVIQQVPIANLGGSSRGNGSPVNKPQPYKAVFQPTDQENEHSSGSQSHNLGQEYLDTFDPVMKPGRVPSGMYGSPLVQQQSNVLPRAQIQLPNTESPTNKYQPFGNLGVPSGYDRFQGGFGGFYTPQAQQQVQNKFARDGELSAKSSMANKQPANLSPSSGQFNPIGGFSTFVQQVARRRPNEEQEDN